ncbi:Pentatricopeptide repeat-containing protein [Actinidia chinensis var. chinensis]|uniref:Pentatricopeptide repeat-containing protein n=1 Tax=Actinidia chinensis var. chinensis TaxID=1590841 RepID=A0A2R6QI43_ACTCC|nr:Pentatricopeptide repeat-containing protein [Actinidia chinensis var. chinensis]
MNEVSAVDGKVRVTDTKHLKKEFRLFHRYIAYNIIPKARHYNQVTKMAFIIYKAAMDEPLNLNYIIFKEMANVKNHSNRVFPCGALLTKVFNHFRVKLSAVKSILRQRMFNNHD